MKKTAIEKMKLEEKKEKPNSTIIEKGIIKWKNMLGPTEFDKLFCSFRMMAENQHDLPEQYQLKSMI